MEDVPCVDLTDEHVRGFQRQGFLNLGRITTEQELAWLRGVYDKIIWFWGIRDKLIKQKRDCTLDEPGEVSGEHVRPALLTIVSPERLVPALNNTLFWRHARQVVACLLDVRETDLLSGWRIFFKPAHVGKTPWHQDAAYRPPPHHGASVWMSLDDVTPENSCMYYIGGTHLGEVQSHHFHDNHMIADDVDPSQAIACPVAAGGATVHHCRTLHSAGPNETDAPRRALVVVSQVLGDNGGRPRNGHDYCGLPGS